MKKIPYIIAEIIDNYKLILTEAKRLPQPRPLTEDERKEGLRVSKLGSSAPTDVPMTPIMSEILKRAGDKTSDDWRLLVDAPETKGEKWTQQTIMALLREYNGPENTEYNTNLELDSVQHYNVGCWRAKKDNLRDVQPGQNKERLEVSQKYARESKALNLLDLLANDVVFQKAVMIVCDALPSVKANNEWELVSQPFMNKDSNVTYPYFKNDRAVNPKTGKTYGQEAVELAKKVGLAGVYKYNYTTLFGRNQKGKGRMICATSRVPNVIFNQLEAEEIKAYREKCPLFVGYKDDLGLKEALISMTNFCKKNGLKCRNVDQAKFDLHVNEAFIVLVGAISMLKANGTKSKEIAMKRAAMMTKSWLINGLSDSVYEIFGRIFSGYIDTNRGGGLVNAIAVLYAIMKQNPDHSKWVYMTLFWMLVMGDDNLFIYERLDYNQFVKDLASLNFEVNESKDEYGPFFLQYRLFKPENSNEYVMAYPWPRVLRSMLFKEQAKGLGPYGWVLAFWQQIAKCIEYKPSLEILVNFIAHFDSFHLCLDMPVKDLLKKIEEEDQLAAQKNKTPNSRSKFTSTLEKLYDGDPQKERFTNPTYLEELQSKMREVYNPNYFNEHHLVDLRA